MEIHYLGSVRFPKEYSKQFLQIGIDILPAAITSKKTPKNQDHPETTESYTLFFIKSIFLKPQIRNHMADCDVQDQIHGQVKM